MSEQFIGFWGDIPVYVEELPKPIDLPSTRDHGKRSSGSLVVVGSSADDPAADARAAGAGSLVRPAFLKRGMIGPLLGSEGRARSGNPSVTGGRKHGARR